MPPTWTILVPTLGERRVLFQRMISLLLPQTEKYDGRVQVVARFNDGYPPLPVIRQKMLMQTETDYVSFVDDDDIVSAYFVDEVMTALDSDPDYVGFQVQCYSDGRPTGVAYHSLKHFGWVNESDRYLRDISHINPMRTRIARLADFRAARAGAAEDRAWVAQLRRQGNLRTEVVIPRIMYHYLYSTSRTPGEGSRWQKPATIRRGTGRLEITHPNFRWSDS